VKQRSVALSIAVALWCSLLGSPCHAATFIGVLWPLFGPLAAPGLTQFVTELQAMPDIEVVTYWHTEWSKLVDDINRQPDGTHILVIGYSLGANNTVLVANNVNYIDSVIALQPSIFTHKTALTGRVGRMVEIYDPNPLLTFGGMGSQKLEGPNIEYIANNDTHIGAPYNAQFRDLVRSEIARLAAEPDPTAAPAIPNTAQPIPNAAQAKKPVASNPRH
jgi:dienelactone hydrolase